MRQKRIRDYGVLLDDLPTGPLNKITDVPGVRVGHATIDTAQNKTGVTVLLPRPENPFSHQYPAASFVLNGFGKSIGLVQIDEWARWKLLSRSPIRSMSAWYMMPL